MRYAVIVSGVVVNAVEATQEVAAANGLIALPDGFGPGDLYSGSAFSKGPVVAPPTNAQILNAALIQPGSVFRGLALTVLDLAKGTIPINPSYTTQDLLNAITARMG